MKAVLVSLPENYRHDIQHKNQQLGYKPISDSWWIRMSLLTETTQAALVHSRFHLFPKAHQRALSKNEFHRLEMTTNPNGSNFAYHLVAVGVGGHLCTSSCCCWGLCPSLHIILLLLGRVAIFAYHLAAVGVGGHLCISSCCCWGCCISSGHRWPPAPTAARSYA